MYEPAEAVVGRFAFASADEIMRMDRPDSPWNALAIKTLQRDPFCCTTAWQLSFHEAVSPYRRLIVKQAEDAVLCFAEKIFSKDDIYLTPIEPNWFFGGSVLGKNGVDLLQDMLPEIERHYAPAFPKIMVSAIVPHGRIYKQLRLQFSSQFEIWRHSSDVQCGASLDGGIDGFLSRRSGNRRKHLKKQERSAREKGVSYERCSPASPEEASKIYDRMIVVERASWKGLEEDGILSPKMKPFYAVMLKRLARWHCARVMFARHEGKDIGFIFGGLAGPIYRGQQFSYDQAWSDASIGNLLQLEQVRWLCEENAARYDMGPFWGDRMEYKAHWTEQRFPIETWVLERK
jgi:hypothetical protein